MLVDVLKGMAGSIYNELGSGFDECVYQKAFEVELRLAGLSYENQRILPIYYRGYNIGESKADLVVKDEQAIVIIELKAIGATLSVKEETQLRKYMESLHIEQGILVNFPQAGRKSNADVPEIIVIGGNQ